jgi:hypothetical protein
MEAVDRLDARQFQWTSDRRANKFRCYSSEMLRLSDALEDAAEPGPAMAWYHKAVESEIAETLDMKACVPPAVVRRELDEIRQILTRHADTLPVYTLYTWTNLQGQPAALESVHGFLDGQEAFLVGGWDPPRLDLMIDGARVRSGLGGTALLLNAGAPDGPELDIAIERRSFLTCYAPILDGLHEICDKALARDGLVCCFNIL